MNTFPNGCYAMPAFTEDKRIPEVMPNENNIDFFVRRDGNVIYILHWDVKYLVDPSRNISLKEMLDEVRKVNNGPLSTITTALFNENVLLIALDALRDGKEVNLNCSKIENIKQAMSVAPFSYEALRGQILTMPGHELCFL